MTRRVVVTGMGCISSLGPDSGAFWQSLVSGRSGVRQMEREEDRVLFEARGEDPRWVGAGLRDYEPREHFTSRRLRYLDPVSQYALIAAREAVSMAGITFDDERRARSSVILGTSVGGDVSRDQASARAYLAKTSCSPFTIVRAMSNALACNVTIEFGIVGHSMSINSACASATQAVGLGAQFIRSGLADIVIAGGSEALPSPGLLHAWRMMAALSPDRCSPFALNRKGVILGEGAGVVVLESLSGSRARGATVLAEILGSGSSADADDLTQPSPEGIGLAMKSALRDAGVRSADVDYINAHGTGTELNDLAETSAIKQVFGERSASDVSISSTKSMHGHALGAAGGLELVATVHALRTGIVPPTINYDEPDPRCDLDYTPNEPRERDVKIAMSNSFGFGGLNSVLVVGR